MKNRTQLQIKALKFKVIIGTQPHEREQPQELLADVSFEYDASLASETDALGHAVDYAAVYEKIMAKVSGTKFLLLERLAGFILSIIMEDTRVMFAEVALYKQGVFPSAGVVVLKMSSQASGKTVNTARCY